MIVMPQQAWNKKRERQYEHIKDSLKDKGRSESTAEEIAARTVNKTRAQQGESEPASSTSVNDKSPSERGGQRSHQGPQGRTKAELYEDAKRLDIEGRSDMDKDELEHAVKQTERQKDAKKD